MQEGRRTILHTQARTLHTHTSALEAETEALRDGLGILATIPSPGSCLVAGDNRNVVTFGAGLTRTTNAHTVEVLVPLLAQLHLRGWHLEWTVLDRRDNEPAHLLAHRAARLRLQPGAD